MVRIPDKTSSSPRDSVEVDHNFVVGLKLGGGQHFCAQVGQGQPKMGSSGKAETLPNVFQEVVPAVVVVAAQADDDEPFSSGSGDENPLVQLFSLEILPRLLPEKAGALLMLRRLRVFQPTNLQNTEETG